MGLIVHQKHTILTKKCINIKIILDLANKIL